MGPLWFCCLPLALLPLLAAVEGKEGAFPGQNPSLLW